jgi:hypothetical protein
MKKKAYTTPQLTVHGSVEKITLRGGRGGPPGGGPPGGGPPGHISS